MVFSSFLTLIFAEIVKPFLATVLSVVMALTSIITGSAGEYAKLSAKTLSFDPMHASTDYEISVNIGEISALAGTEIPLEEIPGIYSDGIFALSGSIDLYTDLENLRLALEVGGINDENYGLYLDSGALALSPDLTRAFVAIDGEEYAAAYDKYMDGKAFALGFDELSGEIFDAEDTEEITSFTEFFKAYLEDIEKAMTAEDTLKLLADFYKPILENVEKYYSETTVDGVKAYTYKMTGKDFIEYYSYILETMYSEETLDSLFAYAKALLKHIDFSKYAEIFGVPAEEFAMPTDQEIDEILSEVKAEILAEGAEINALFQLIFDILLTGENIEALGELAVIRNYLDDSYMQSTVYEKDGAIYEVSEIVITNGETELFSVKSNTVVEEYDGEVAAASELLTGGNALDFDEFERKVAYDNAVTKGVNSVEIDWYSDMTPEDTVPSISATGFMVNYKTENPTFAGYKDNPDFTDEQKAEIEQMILEGYGNETRYFDSSAHLIDGSIYLPLRQIMESSGYEVSWDEEARKAYVNVGDEKIDMTGTIIDNRTYVKIRDFEKLGATVEYDEYIYYAEAYNDFSKSCYATITFAK